MPSIELAYVNVAMNAFGLIVTLIIFSACLGEWITKHTGSKFFLALLGLVTVALIADIVSWIGEGHPELRTMTVISNTVASCTGQLSMICFMEYLCHSLYENSRAAKAILNLFRILCFFSILYSVGNAFLGYSFIVNDAGHYVHGENDTMVLFHLLFPITTFATMILMSLFATRSVGVGSVAFLFYTLPPIAGIITDHLIHGFSLTYVGIVISILVIYTDIYLQRQRQIEAQKNALMLSQINPHFMYNTFSTIAAMCDTSPKLAKGLTIDFSRYLRQNLETMTTEQVIPFEQELSHVECYLRIEKARFRERLNVIYSVQCKDFFLPPLTIQPIVENAVKHGITKRAAGGTLRISSYAFDKLYVVEIIDDGVGFDPETLSGLKKGHHVGIENVESRLRRMCRGSIRIKSTPGVGTRVTIEIPRRKGKKK